MKKVKAKKAKKPLPAREAAAQVGKKPQMQSEPKPTFAKQHQDAPGLESKLKPRPRYEASRYRAAGKLIGKVALITGGDSGIGRAVAVLSDGKAGPAGGGRACVCISGIRRRRFLHHGHRPAGDGGRDRARLISCRGGAINRFSRRVS